MAGLRLAAENIRLTNENTALREKMQGLKAELAAAKYILTGREVAPTEEELAAHEEAGGGWLVAHEDGVYTGIAPLEDLDEDLCTRWWALGPDGTPCAWPKAAQ